MKHDFLFESGQFKPTVVFPPEGKVTNLDDQLRAAGFIECQSFGDTNGTHFDLHERDVADTGREWLVVFGTPFSWSLIACHTWPDLYELLAKLSPIATASVLDGRVVRNAVDLVEHEMMTRGLKPDMG